MVRKWLPDSYFQRGTIVSFGSSLYRSSTAHTSAAGRNPTEAPQLWAPLDSNSTSTLPPSPGEPHLEDPPLYVHPEHGASTSTVNSISSIPPHVPGYGFYTYLPAGHHPVQYQLPLGYRPLYDAHAPHAPFLHAPKPQHPVRPPDPDAELPSGPGTQPQPPPDHVMSAPFSFARFIEAPSHPAYRALMYAARASETNESRLKSEMRGETDAMPCVAGFGLWAYRQNEQGEPIKRKIYAELQSDDDAGREMWLEAARARTKQYYEPGAVRPALRWVLVEPKAGFENAPPAVIERHAFETGSFPRIPSDVLQTGTEASGTALCSARAWHAGGVHLGKAGRHLQAGGASLSYDSLEHELNTFEVLVGDALRVRWIEASQINSQLASGGIPVEGGREAHGGAMLVAQASCEGGWHPGKAAVGEDHACVGFGGGEFWVRGFRVLVWADEH